MILYRKREKIVRINRDDTRVICLHPHLYPFALRVRRKNAILPQW